MPTTAARTDEQLLVFTFFGHVLKYIYGTEKKINYSNVKRTCRKKKYYSVFAGLVIRLATQIKNVFKTYFIFEFKTIGY